MSGDDEQLQVSLAEARRILYELQRRLDQEPAGGRRTLLLANAVAKAERLVEDLRALLKAG